MSRQDHTGIRLGVHAEGYNQKPACLGGSRASKSLLPCSSLPRMGSTTCLQAETANPRLEETAVSTLLAGMFKQSLVCASIQYVAFDSTALQLHDEISVNFSGHESCTILI